MLTVSGFFIIAAFLFVLLFLFVPCQHVERAYLCVCCCVGCQLCHTAGAGCEIWQNTYYTRS